MSKSSNKVAVLVAAMLAVPAVAICGVVALDDARKAAPAGYTLRCWQEGRLILEEHHVTFPPGIDAASAKLQVIDRQNLPMVVADTRNATCVVRARPVERAQSPLP